MKLLGVGGVSFIRSIIWFCCCKFFSVWIWMSVSTAFCCRSRGLSTFPGL